MDYLLFAAGLGLLIGSADRLVQAAGALATRLGVSPLTTAVVVVGFGTSMPELLTCLDAALQGSPALAVANVVGSNIANCLLVLGLSAVCAPIRCEPGPMRRDLAALFLASLLALLAFQGEIIDRAMGAALALGMLLYLATLLTGAGRLGPSRSSVETRAAANGGGTLAGDMVRALLSIAALMAGAHLMVSGALGIATSHGISERIIGLSLVAVGTSLPELAVAALALVRRRAAIAIGNILGSCLFNLLGILGLTALVSPLAVPVSVAHFDAWIMLAAALALTLFVRTGWRVSRAEGAALLVAYPAYLAAVFR